MSRSVSSGEGPSIKPSHSGDLSDHPKSRQKESRTHQLSKSEPDDGVPADIHLKPFIVSTPITALSSAFHLWLRNQGHC